jgi:hypothetical protein
MYPPTEKAPNGKLRLMYEANPMSMLIEQAGGKSFSGLERTLEIQPRELHQRASVILGSAGEVEKVQEFLQWGGGDLPAVALHQDPGVGIDLMRSPWRELENAFALSHLDPPQFATDEYLHRHGKRHIARGLPSQGALATRDVDLQLGELRLP